MKTEQEIKEHLQREIQERIQKCEEDLKAYRKNLERLQSIDPSDDVVFAYGDSIDWETPNFLEVRVGMSFSNKYGEQGKITQINEDRKTVQAINKETQKEDTFYIERFNHCYFDSEDS